LDFLNAVCAEKRKEPAVVIGIPKIATVVRATAVGVLAVAAGRIEDDTADAIAAAAAAAIWVLEPLILRLEALQGMA
jgi:transcriptional regulator of nitric oxide reductase